MLEIISFQMYCVVTEIVQIFKPGVSHRGPGTPRAALEGCKGHPDNFRRKKSTEQNIIKCSSAFVLHAEFAELFILVSLYRILMSFSYYGSFFALKVKDALIQIHLN